MAKKTSSQKHAQLKQLSKECKQHIYDMLRLTSEMLDDHEYVNQFGGEGPLLDQLEAEEFVYFGGQPALATMVRAYRHNPLRDTWAEYNFNLRAMIDLATPERDGRQVEKINWKARCAELESQLEALKNENKTLRDLIVQRATVAV